MKSLSIINQKGGVGKTTTSVNLCSALARKGYKVLLVDFDSQANATSGLLQENPRHFLYDVLINNLDIQLAIQKTTEENLFLLPSNKSLAAAELELADFPKREFVFKRSLEKLSTEFDFLFMDCPPTLSLLTINALCASDSFLIPLQCEYYALEGLSQLLNTADQIKENFNPELTLEGIILTLFDPRNRLSHQVKEQALLFFKEKVFNTSIRRNVRLSEAPSYSQNIFQYAPDSMGAQNYLDLSTEFVERQNTNKTNHYSLSDLTTP